MDAEDLIEQNSDFFVTETTLRKDMDPATMLEFLAHMKLTGTLTFELNQGGVRKVRVSEKTKAPEAQRDQIRELLGMK